MRTTRSVPSLLLVALALGTCPALAQWTHASGPVGAQVETFLRTGAAMFVGTTSGVFRSTDNGLWRSTDSGTSWTSLTFSGVSNVPSAFAIRLISAQNGDTIDLRADSLYAFTPVLAESKFSVAVGRAGSIESALAADRPTAFALGRSFPNPFNPSTTLPVEIAAATEASLKVYSMLGAEVAVLQQGSLQAGRYWFVWKGADALGRPAATGGSTPPAAQGLPPEPGRPR